ncbi:hypothetical protein VP01_2523g2 [Puccinia sorghi]|uniref:Uncharacterized protein n=1 Tax=Puccinia sorghi TaxID=27349 RepID=A0A0L6V5H7_9BASI|nr:hypothetical protein VP01_2523g2 [Puccinia sorghi]
MILNASQLLSGEPISSAVDLNHHTLSSFLDKFAYRQAKKNQPQKGSAIMQPDLHYRLADVVKRRPTPLSENVPVNSKGFLNRQEEEIPVDEVSCDSLGVFFHKFFKKKEMDENKHKKLKEQGKSKKGLLTEDNDFGGRGGSDDGSEEEEDASLVLEGYDDDDEEDKEMDEDEVWAAMKSSMGKKDLQAAMPDDVSDEDEWSAMDPAEFEDSDDGSHEGQVQGLIAAEETDDSESGSSAAIDSEMENEAISVSGLDDSSSCVSENHRRPSASRKRKSAPSAPPDHTSPPKTKKPKKKAAWKSLPTFAAADDYLHLLSDLESL